MRALLIFGAPANDQGEATGTLRRRVLSALDASKGISNCLFIASGGAVKSSIVEADLIKDLLERSGVGSERIIMDRSSKDTLETVLNCKTLVDEIEDIDVVTPCTSKYHVFRCVALMKALKIPLRMEKMPSEVGRMSPLKLAKLYCKEVVATPIDIMTLLIRRKYRKG